MKRMLPVATTLLFALVVALLIRSDGARGGASAGLPGARAAVDASQFPTIQAALDALPSEGGVVRLPAGKFEISQPLVIRSEDVLLIGAGTATHIHNTNTEGRPALLVRPDGYEQDKKKRLWRIKLTDFRITGNEKSGDGVAAFGINEIFIQGLTVSYHGGHGILLDHCYEDPRVSDSLITYNKKSGLELLGCHDIVVAANQFEENLDAVRCLDGFNLCMTGNCVDDHLRHGVVIENTYGSVVSGNMIEECQGWAVVLDRDCYGITISANVIAHEFQGGIDLRDAHGCAISANTFTIVRPHALRIGPNSGRITVTGNNFSDSFIGEGAEKRRSNDQAAGGIVVEGASDIAVSGNVFSGLSTPAVENGAAPGRRVVFANNVLTEVESQHDGLKESVTTNNVPSK